MHLLFIKLYSQIIVVFAKRKFSKIKIDKILRKIAYVTRRRLTG